MPQKLNKESMLLMYVADELSAADRAEVDRRLASDPVFAAELRRLESSVRTFEAAMARLDATALPHESIIVRRIGLAMRQHIADDLSAEVASTCIARRRTLRYPGWAYPAAAAAAVLIAFVSWWGHRPDGTLKLPAIGGAMAVVPMPEEEQKQVATDMEKSFEDTNLTQTEKSVASLESAEYQLAELSRSRAGTATSDFGFSDSHE
jgi:hypothetical protein